jgi:hypothetical protein
MPTFVDRRHHVVSATDPYSHILIFLDQSLKANMYLSEMLPLRDDVYVQSVAIVYGESTWRTILCHVVPPLLYSNQTSRTSALIIFSTKICSNCNCYVWYEGWNNLLIGSVLNFSGRELDTGWRAEHCTGPGADSTRNYWQPARGCSCHRPSAASPTRYWHILLTGLSVVMMLWLPRVSWCLQQSSDCCHKCYTARPDSWTELNGINEFPCLD